MSSRGRITIEDDVMAILKSMTFETTYDGFLLGRLPTVSLDRKLYLRVNKVLEALDGIWNRKKRGHLFANDPRKEFNDALDNGVAVDRKKALNAFYTPPEVAARVANLAGSFRGKVVLEPSAGDGALIKAALAAASTDSLTTLIRFVAVEIDPAAIHALRALGSRMVADHFHADTLDIRLGDFLTMTRGGLIGDRYFDTIIMNPPFENGADLKHIGHAYSMLRPGGRLVSICADGPRQRDHFASFGFGNSVVSSYKPLPEGSFKDAGTMVNTAIVVLNKPKIVRERL